MNIWLNSIECSKELAFLKLRLDPPLFAEIKKNKWFNFSESFFEISPPHEFADGEITLVADRKKADGLHQETEVSLNPENWQVFQIQFDDRIHETFLSLRLQGKIPGSLTEAVLEFTRNKTVSAKDIPEETEQLIKEVFEDLLEFSEAENLNETNFQNLLSRMVSKAGGSEQKIELESALNAYLRENSIPFENIDNIYVFQVNADQDTWEVAITVSESGDRLLTISSTKVEGSEPTLEALREELDIINRELNIGKFELDNSGSLISLKSEILFNLYSTENNLDSVIESNFDHMSALISLLKMRYKDQLNFFC